MMKNTQEYSHIKLEILLPEKAIPRTIQGVFSLSVSFSGISLPIQKQSILYI
jgi:hypothetical protein